MEPPVLWNTLIEIVLRPKDLDSDSVDDFINRLTDYLNKISPNLQEQISQEPKRLLSMGEYRSAVISALSLFEVKLREKIQEIEPYSRGLRIYSIRQLLDVARLHDIITIEMQQKLSRWYGIRNEIVHTGRNVRANDARQIVDEIITYTSKIREPTKRHPILNERDRTILGTKFFERLCDLDRQVSKRDHSHRFTKEEIWEHNLGAYNIEIVYPVVIDYLQKILKYATVTVTEELASQRRVGRIVEKGLSCL